MRRLSRLALPLEGRRSLYRRTKVCDSAETAREMWKPFRKSVEIRPIVSALEQMAGPRQRCAYCSDSHASDIDHFRPIARYHGSTFEWSNFMWVCTPCNRKKASTFPTGADGQPLMIDPTRVDPWRHLTLDTASGVVAPRYVGDHFDVYGECTLDVLPTINYEAVADGRARICRRVRRAVESVNATPTPELVAELLAEAAQDDVGVSRWYGFWEGAGESEMVVLRKTRHNIWRRFLRACA